MAKRRSAVARRARFRLVDHAKAIEPFAVEHPAVLAVRALDLDSPARARSLIGRLLRLVCPPQRILR